MSAVAMLRKKLASVWPLLDERTRRIMAAHEAMGLGYGGISLVRRACGLSRKAIAKGIQEITERSCPVGGRIRRGGAGRKKITAIYADGSAKMNLGIATVVRMLKGAMNVPVEVRTSPGAKGLGPNGRL